MSVDAREALPSVDRMPDRVYTLPQLRYPPKLNVAVERLDANDAETSAAVVWGDLRDELEKAQLQAPALKRLIVAGAARPGDTTLASLTSGQPDRCAAVDTERDDIAMIAYTSGSTGIPKGCVHFHRDILASADAYALHVLAPSPEDRFGGHPTLAFTFGTGGLLVFPFRFGAATVLSGGFTPESMLETFAKQRVTICFCAPTSYRLMLGVANLTTRFDLGALRLGVSAAEPLPAATWQAWKDTTGVEVLDGIGSTELFHIFVSSVAGR